MRRNGKTLARAIKSLLPKLHFTAFAHIAHTISPGTVDSVAVICTYCSFSRHTLGFIDRAKRQLFTDNMIHRTHTRAHTHFIGCEFCVACEPAANKWLEYLLGDKRGCREPLTICTLHAIRPNHISCSSRLSKHYMRALCAAVPHP